MKAKLLDLNGKEKGSIDLPKSFSKKIREDVVAKVLEARKTEQPYSASPVAGKQHSASGIIVHRRHVWKSGYGRGISRIPRKIMSKRGSQFHWVGAEIASAVGGRRAHGPKVLARINTKKINKKEMKIALESALSATADEKKITKRYKRLKDKKLEKDVPLVVDSKLSTLKTKTLISAVKKILGKDLFELGVQKKQIRSGKGKARGRKHKTSAGLLIVIGNKEKLKTNAFEVVRVGELSLTDLAKGGVGRLTLYTEEAIKELKGEKPEKAEEKQK
jgi:large subunit ribosomal protein L4e